MEKECQKKCRTCNTELDITEFPDGSNDCYYCIQDKEEEQSLRNGNNNKYSRNMNYY